MAAGPLPRPRQASEAPDPIATRSQEHLGKLHKEFEVWAEHHTLDARFLLQLLLALTPEFRAVLRYILRDVYARMAVSPLPSLHESESKHAAIEIRGSGY